MARYRNVGNHAEQLADGTMVPVGEFVDIEADETREPLVEDLLAREVLIGVDEDASHEGQLAARRVKTRVTKQQKQAATEEES